MATESGRRAPFRAPLLTALLLFFALPASVARGAPCCFAPSLGGLLGLVEARAGLPPEHRPATLLLRDDEAGTLHSSLVELARRRGGRAMLRRLVESDFITVLVSERLRPMQAGLWGPIFHRGQVLGAALYVDLLQIHGFDHDPTGVQTLAHELRHQVDAARAFGDKGTYRAVYRAAASGDRTRSAERYGARIRQQLPDLTAEEATLWLEPLLTRSGPRRGALVARALDGTAPSVAESAGGDEP